MLMSYIIFCYLKFGQARLAHMIIQPWSSLSIAYYASIMLPALIDPKLYWESLQMGVIEMEDKLREMAHVGMRIQK